ncbi:MAG: acetate--CoA ligase family protein, partial [Eubacterium sp.]|nr:acetate--CoA ligase family protein [Candidatus Colimonas fimequi]
AFAGFRNPIDLTVEGTGEQYQKAIELALTERDAAIVIYVGTPYLKAMPIAEAVVNAAKSSGKPVCAMFQVGSDMEESMAYLRENNVPHFELGEDAATVLSIMAEYEEKRKALAEQWGDEIPYCFEEMEAAGSAFPDGKNSLLEPEAMQLLIDNGVNGKPFVWAKSEEEAVAGAEEIGYPLVIKVVSPDIVHKSDVGGVRVNVKNADEVRDAWNHMAKISEGLDFQGVVVYPLSPMGKEVILGLTQDPTFGPIVAFGMGGIYTEVLKDITFRVAPINKEEATNMINEIKMAPMLKGVRGEAPCDLDKLADMIANFSQLAIKYPDIKEADINPVFLYEDDAVAVDVRVLK